MNYRKSFARDGSDERGTILLVSDPALGFHISLSFRRPTKQCQHIKLHATDIYRNASVNTQQGLVLPNIQLCLYEAIKVQCFCFGTMG